jgi:putative cell wall-binding protein
MKKILSLLLALALLLSFPTAVFAVEETQTITIEMKDSYGDGWDGFMLKVCLVNADDTETVLEQNITISSGSRMRRPGTGRPLRK